LRAFIPTHRVLCIIKDVLQDFSLKTLREFTLSSIKILEFHLLNRRVEIEGEIKYPPLRTICVKFAGQFLPQYVSIFSCRYPVSLFISKIRICFSCFRVGHLSKTCKNQLCIYCGNVGHNAEEECTSKNSPPCCINCRGAHLPTSHNCPVVIKHKMTISLASTENIPIADAKKKIAVSSSNYSPSYTDSRYDFQNFPNLPSRQQSPPSYRPLNQSFTDPNAFSVLASLPPDYESPLRRTFSSIAVRPL